MSKECNYVFLDSYTLILHLLKHLIKHLLEFLMFPPFSNILVGKSVYNHLSLKYYNIINWFSRHTTIWHLYSTSENEMT